MERLSTAIQRGVVRSCHDCSEGGIAVAAAEMAYAGGYGMHLNLDAVPTGDAMTTTDDVLLFSESTSRFVVEVEPQHEETYKTCMADVPTACIGTVIEDTAFIVTGTNGKHIVETSIDVLKAAWQGTLQW